MNNSQVNTFQIMLKRQETKSKLINNLKFQICNHLKNLTLL